MKTRLGLIAVLLTCGTVTASAQDRDDWPLHQRYHDWRRHSNLYRVERMRAFREFDRTIHRRMWNYDRLPRFDGDRWRRRDLYRERYGPYRMQPRIYWRDDAHREWRRQMRQDWLRRDRSGAI